MMSSDRAPYSMVVERHHDFLEQMKTETNLENVSTGLAQLGVSMMARGINNPSAITSAKHKEKNCLISVSGL